MSVEKKKWLMGVRCMYGQCCMPYQFRCFYSSLLLLLPASKKKSAAMKETESEGEEKKGERENRLSFFSFVIITTK